MGMGFSAERGPNLQDRSDVLVTPIGAIQISVRSGAKVPIDEQGLEFYRVSFLPFAAAPARRRETQREQERERSEVGVPYAPWLTPTPIFPLIPDEGPNPILNPTLAPMPVPYWMWAYG